MQAFYSINGQKNANDLCLLLYGSLDYLIKLVTENPFIKSVNFDLTLFGGTKVSYDDSVSQKVPQNLKPSSVPNNIQGIYVVNQGQGLSDLVLHSYSSLDNFVKLIVDNNLGSINLMPDELLGKNLIFDMTLSKNPVVQNYNKNKKIVYATGFNYNRDTERFRLLEDGNYRLLEDGNYRLLE